MKIQPHEEEKQVQGGKIDLAMHAMDENVQETPEGDYCIFLSQSNSNKKPSEEQKVNKISQPFQPKMLIADKQLDQKVEHEAPQYETKWQCPKCKNIIEMHNSCPKCKNNLEFFENEKNIDIEDLLV